MYHFWIPVCFISFHNYKARKKLVFLSATFSIFTRKGGHYIRHQNSWNDHIDIIIYHSNDVAISPHFLEGKKGSLVNCGATPSLCQHSYRCMPELQLFKALCQWLLWPLGHTTFIIILCLIMICLVTYTLIWGGECLSSHKCERVVQCPDSDHAQRRRSMVNTK